MAFVPEKDTEPIPGYQLVEKLGSGGYGEVWKATAPGGLTKAIKFIFGGEAGAQAEQERKALHRVKEVRHPFLLSLERIEIVSGGLVIVTELAEGCLQDRFAACRQAGLWGIPRAELLGYLRDAADALDYMRETHDLQHLDVKPQNLLLVAGRVKVADFGLVKELTNTCVTATGGVTPVYAPPEAFDGRVSRFSDQYSLAIVYQEMLTGLRPFPGRTAMQLAAQHVGSPPLLDPLPPGDRPVIARALAKTPEARFPTCREMVDNLLREKGGTAPQSVSWMGSEGSLADVATAVSPSQMGREAENAPPPATGPEPAVARSVELTQAQVLKPGLRPTLFVGIGGLAGAALQRLRLRLERRFGKPAEVPIFRLLLVDTDRAELRQIRLGASGEPLENEEAFLAPLHPPEFYRPQAKNHLRWLDRRWLYGIPRSLQTEGLRPLGRLALVDNAAGLLPRLREALTAITSPEAAATTAAHTSLPLREEGPRVFLVASVAGGTGSGMLLGMAYAVRQVLAEMRLPTSGLCGLLLHATSPKPSEQEMARANAYATLNELDHFSQPAAIYPGDPDFGLTPFGPEVPPFEDCYLVHLGERLTREEAAAATCSVADYLELNACPAGGTFLDRYRQNTHLAQDGIGSSVALRSFGLFRITAPGPRLVGLTSNLLCDRVIGRWLGSRDEAEGQSLEEEVQRKLATLGLEEKPLQARFQSAAGAALEEGPDACFTRLVASAGTAPAPPTPEIAAELLKTIHAVLGTGADPNNSTAGTLTALETTLQGHAKDLAARQGRALLEWLLDLVEKPGRRLQAADVAASALVKHLATASENFDDRLATLRVQRTTLRQQLAAGNLATKGSGLRWLGLCRAPGAAGTSESNRKFLDYCWLRLTEATLEAAAIVVREVRGRVGQFAHELATCRQKLTQVAASFQPTTSARLPAPNLLELLPDPAGTPEAGAEILLNSFPCEFVRRFEEAFQRDVLDPRGGLWGIVAGDFLGPRTATGDLLASMNWSDPVRGLVEELRTRALADVRRILQERDSAQQFVDLRGGPENAPAALLEHVESARPLLRFAEGWEHLVVAMPEGPAGDLLREGLAAGLPELPLTALPSDNDVFLCREAAHYPLQKVAVALADQATHAELAERLMTRTDVNWKSLAALGSV